MDYSDEYDSMAEEWEGKGYSKGTGGGAGAGAKKKKKATTVGKKRDGGAQAWGTDQSRCAVGCKMKCCASKKVANC
jgi:hypothetical protein